MNHLNIILGNKAFFNRTVFQACACQTTNYREARSATQQMKQKFKNCTWAGIVYKIPTGEDCYEEIPTIGKKMLLLMNRMNSNNLTIGVGIWYSGNITNHDRNRMVLDRVMDMINYLNSLSQVEVVKIEEKVEDEVIEPDPINSHKYLNFPQRPEPCLPVDFDTRILNLTEKMEKILENIDNVEANSIHELTSHNHVGFVLRILFCLLNKIPYTVKRAKQFFFRENFVELLKEFDPNLMKKRKIRELKKMLKDCQNLDLKKIEKVSHTSMIMLEYFGLIIEFITDVEMPKPVEKVEEVQSEAVEERKKIVYHGLKKKKKKKRLGEFMQVKEMVADENNRIMPMKIAINVRDASIVNLEFGHLAERRKKMHKGLKFSSIERGDSHAHKFFINRSQDLTPAPSWKNKISVLSLNSNKKLKNYSLRSIDLSKKSQIFSKVSLNESKKSIGLNAKSITNDEELIDKVLHLNPSKIDFGMERAESDTEIVKGINNNDIEKQPMSVLLKFAEILRVRRETHSLL